MPAEFDKCVRGMMSDPDFKAKDGKSKKDGAFAVCTTMYKKRHGGQSPMSASFAEYYDRRDLMCLSTIIYSANNIAEAVGSDYEVVKDTEVKSLFTEVYSTTQDWISKAALLRKRLYPDEPEMSSTKSELEDLTLEELMQRDDALRMTVLLLETDKEIQRLNGIS